MGYAVLGLVRDILKSLYLGMIQICSRLYYIEREFPSSISLNARLDVLPRAAHHERHKLIIRKRSLIEAQCVINTWHGDVIIEEGASVGIGSIILGPVQIGEKSVCAQNCFICGQSHLYQDVSMHFLRQGLKIQQVVIGKNVWIGSHTVILPGVSIGSNSIIGAGSIVVEDIPSYSMALGNPARVIKHYDFRKERWVRT
jgi:acetyltransferase-like isoleucine patch superfamily enzyme